MRPLKITAAAIFALLTTVELHAQDGSPSVDTTVNWMAEIQKGISEREYHITSNQSDVLQSPNRSQNLRFSYSPTGFSITTRADSLNLENWTIQMDMEGIYRGDVKLLGMDSDQTLEIENNHLQYHHSAGFTIEYINEIGGMRQNFIVHEKPSGNGLLSVRLLIESELTPMLSHQKELVFAQLEGNTYSAKVRYKDLKVLDAQGHEIKSWMELKGTELALVVNDNNAVYPLTIDPLSTTASTIVESDQADANMGVSVSSAGDVNGDGYSDVIVGAPYYDNGDSDEGAAFVYHGSASGISTTATTLVESDQEDANLGWSVSSAGDVNGDGYSDVIVGAFKYDNGQNNEGAAFIYHGSASGISITAITMVESNQASAYMGRSVSTAGDVNGDGYSDVIVGAYLYDNGEDDEGAAFIYHGSASGISTTASAMVESDQIDAYMGRSVSSAGDVNGDGYSDVIVGAHQYDNGQNNEGAIYIYHGSASGISTTAAAMVESDQADANMGLSVSSAGDVNGDGYSDVIVGAYKYSNGESDEGAAYIYHGSASGISTTAAAIVESNQANANMGLSVSSAGDVNGDGYSDVIVGAYKYSNGESAEGAAFIYHGSAVGIDTTAAAIIESNQVGAYMGYSVSSAGDVNGDGYSDVIVGAYRYDNGENNEGAAFIYHGSASGISTTATAIVESNQENAYMGISVSSAGDVNGDGYSDVIVGAHYYDNGQNREGVAFIYHGSASGISTTATAMVESNQGNARMGYSVSSAGDVNGDGYSDVIVGAYLYNNGQSDEGAVFIYHGSASGIDTTAAAMVESNQAYAYMGSSVSGAGDVNGDGYSDVIVGAYAYNNGQSDEGAAFIYHGSASGISTTATTMVESNQASAWMGRSVSSAGDVNGDGYSDVIVGAFLYNNGENNEGAAFIYHGSASGISTTATVMVQSDQVNAYLGYSVSSAGDVNGDGYSDVIVGAYKYDNGEDDEGAAFIYHGSASGISTTATTIVESNQDDANMGRSVSSAGDVNGDGYSDVIIGAYKYTNGQSDEGAAFIYHGSASGISTSVAALIESNQADANMGNSVSSAGDVNGDGYSDVIVGALYYNNGEIDEGRAFIYHGNEDGNLYRNTRQYRSDLTTPVQTGNASTGSFGIGHFARSNYGRTKVKLVWEVFTEGVPFSGSEITNSVAYQAESSVWTDIGTAGLEIKELLSSVGVYSKWRVRVKYHPATMIDGQVYSRWFYGGIHDESEMSIRTCVTTFGTDVQTTCDTYNWIDGNTYTASNSTAKHILTNVAGCDSLVTLDLTVNYSSSSTDVQMECDTYDWIDGNTYTSDNNTATWTLTNAAGCDSLVTLDLTVNYSSTATDVQAACDTYDWIDGNTYTASNNTATHTLTNAAGCDSLVTLDLTVNYSSIGTGTDVQTACDTYDWIDGNTYTSDNNTATWTLTNAAGCDSIVTLDLTVDYSSTATDVQTACDTYDWIDGNTYMASNNTATHTLTNAAGCDSLVTLDLTVNYSSTSTDVQTACDTYDWIDGNTYTASTSTPTWTLTNFMGCDSTVTLDLSINSTSSTDVITACDSYTWIDGLTYTASNNTVTYVIPNTVGCDSTITLNLTINSVATSTDIITACELYTWIDGNTYASSTITPTYTYAGGASNGCDSTVTLDLTIAGSSTGTDVQIACSNYTWIDGNTYASNNNAATFTYVGGASNGCDSTVTLDLIITGSSTWTDVQTACGSYTWMDGNTYSSNNNVATFTYVGGASNGCDSTITLNLTINSSTSSTDVQVACGSYTWIDGNMYTSSNNSATLVLTNTNGCDSIVTLDLTIQAIDITVAQSDYILSSNESGAAYQWLDCDANYSPISNETNQIFIATANGNYAVEVTSNGCTDTSSCVSVVNVGLFTIQLEEEFIIYPNPSSDGIFFIVNYEMISNLIVYDDLGREMNVVFNASTGKINCATLANGKYTVKLSSDDKMYIRQIIIAE